MSIIRIEKHETNFVILDKHCLENTQLSFGATGLHAYLMGLPNGWNINVKDLVNRKTNGRDAIYTMLKELENHGYLSRVQGRDAGGRVQTCDYIVYENPKPSTASGFAVNGSAAHGESVTSKEPKIVSNHTEWVPGVPPAQPPKTEAVAVASNEQKVGYQQCRRVINAWAEYTKGRPPIGRMVRALSPLIRSLGEQEVLDRLLNYCKATQVKYAAVERFVQTHGQYEAKSPAVPYVNPYEKLDGEL